MRNELYYQVQHYLHLSEYVRNNPTGSLSVTAAIFYNTFTFKYNFLIIATHFFYYFFAGISKYLPPPSLAYC